MSLAMDKICNGQAISKLSQTYCYESQRKKMQIYCILHLLLKWEDPKHAGNSVYSKNSSWDMVSTIYLHKA